MIVLQNGSFSYRETEENGRLCLISYDGTEPFAEVPSEFLGGCVRGVAKKAFWGNKTLVSIFLPDTIEEIGDWAFADCRMLERIRLPEGELCIGNQMFRGCGRLQKITIGNGSEALARLSAMAVVELEAEYLLRQQAGSGIWYQNLDARIIEALRESEETVQNRLVYCAEEDMLQKQEEALCLQKKRKARIAFLRLLYGKAPLQEEKDLLTQYLLSETKGCGTEAAWKVAKEGGGEQFQCVDKLLEIGALHKGNIGAALADLGKEQIELKAYLLRQWKAPQRQETLWEMLKL
ncbi:MAG: leucine-rich repeat protein [Lachnospiraceae bacterium]|nr:leucine-rich repeat protein [Lachnospiraceae bacterium]